MRYLLDMLLPKAPLLRADQINQAQKFYLHHQAEAERHAVLAAMYKQQATRLLGEIKEIDLRDGKLPHGADFGGVLTLHSKGAIAPVPPKL